LSALQRLNLKNGKLSFFSVQVSVQFTNDTIALDGQIQPSSREPAKKDEFSVKETSFARVLMFIKK